MKLRQAINEYARWISALQEILDKEESDREVLRAAVEGMEEN